MKLVFFVTDLKTEKAKYSTYRMALVALKRGHQVYHIDAMSAIAIEVDGTIRLRARRVPLKTYKSVTAYFDDLLSPKAKVEKLDVAEVDILMLRSDPSLAVGEIAWVKRVGIDLGRLAKRQGVIVLNDPDGLVKGIDKMYLNHFPEAIRPISIITRNLQDVKAFLKFMNNDIILKPLQGSSGKGVFLVKKERVGNLAEIVRTIGTEGYMIAQEYIPEASAGDTRLFLMNGKPLMCKGKFAAFRRVNEGEDIRSNVHVGAKIRKAEISSAHLELVEMVRPRLVSDGMFLAGMDIAGSKVLEVNLFCPGGLWNAHKLENADFTGVVIDALEKKVQYKSYYLSRMQLEPAML